MNLMFRHVLRLETSVINPMCLAFELILESSKYLSGKRRKILDKLLD